MWVEKQNVISKAPSDGEKLLFSCHICRTENVLWLCSSKVSSVLLILFFSILSFLYRYGCSYIFLTNISNLQLVPRCWCAEVNANMDTQNTKIIMDATGADANQNQVKFYIFLNRIMLFGYIVKVVYHHEFKTCVCYCRKGTNVADEYTSEKYLFYSYFLGCFSMLICQYNMSTVADLFTLFSPIYGMSFDTMFYLYFLLFAFFLQLSVSNECSYRCL